MKEDYIPWEPDMMVEIELAEPDDFLKVRETLSRIGIPSYKDDKKTLWQSCYILHKQGRYYIVHFKEMFCLDGRPSQILEEDLGRRDRIALLLQEWGLVKLISEVLEEDALDMSSIKVVSFKEKENWQLKTKYKIGTKKT